MANAPLQFPDDRETRSQLRVVRSQAGVVRALLDEVERIHPDSVAGQVVAEQLIDELTRLGCRTLEVAAMLAHGEAVPVPPSSGAQPTPDNVKPFPLVR
jgi:hypothetical protein